MHDIRAIRDDREAFVRGLSRRGMADADAMAAPPCEELSVVAFPWKVRAGAIAEMGLGSPLHGMIARIDPGHRRDRTEFPDRGVGDLGIVHDVGIVVHRHFLQNRARADLAIGAKPGVVQGRCCVDGWFNRKRFAGHANSQERCRLIQKPQTSSMGLMTTS